MSNEVTEGAGMNLVASFASDDGSLTEVLPGVNLQEELLGEFSTPLDASFLIPLSGGSSNSSPP